MPTEIWDEHRSSESPLAISEPLDPNLDNASWGQRRHKLEMDAKENMNQSIKRTSSSSGSLPFTTLLLNIMHESSFLSLYTHFNNNTLSYLMQWIWHNECFMYCYYAQITDEAK
jgi:hypothetical protein